MNEMQSPLAAKSRRLVLMKRTMLYGVYLPVPSLLLPTMRWTEKKNMVMIVFEIIPKKNRATRFSPSATGHALR
jgi:hypothetical protein